MELNKIKFSNGAGLPKTSYAQILINGVEQGFIAPEGIFLRMYHPKIKEGVLRPVKIPSTMTDVDEMCKFLEKHWKAINDGYITVFRGHEHQNQ